MFDDTTNFLMTPQTTIPSALDTDVEIPALLSAFDPFNCDGIQIDYSRELGIVRSVYFARFLKNLLGSLRTITGDDQSATSYRQTTKMWQDKIVESAPSNMKGWIESGGW